MTSIKTFASCAILAVALASVVSIPPATAQSEAERKFAKEAKRMELDVKLWANHTADALALVWGVPDKQMQFPSGTVVYTYKIQKINHEKVALQGCVVNFLIEKNKVLTGYLTGTHGICRGFVRQVPTLKITTGELGLRVPTV